jgi:hypothetical protein
MAISEPYTGSQGTWGTEYSLTNASTTIATQTTDGVYQVFLDLSALALGDVYEFRCYEKVRSADTQRVCFIQTFSNAQGADSANWVSPAMELLNGWDYSLKRTSGSDRTITFSVRAIT